MLKVIIVDDELLVRIGLRSTIQWEQNGFEIIGDFANGQEALDAIKEYSVDILITDIKMPKMDGIELTRKVKEISDSIKIIILTCYDEFNYAKQALLLGANDYIIKSTMEPSDLLNSLLKIKKEIEINLKKHEEINLLKAEVENQRSALKQKVLLELFKGEFNSEQNIINNLKRVDIEFKYPHYCLICFKIDNFELNYRKIDLISKRLLRDSILNICNSIMTSNYNGIVIEVIEGTFTCILSVNTSLYSCEDAGIKFCGMVQEAVKSYTRITVSCVISSGINDIKKVSTNYENAVNYLKYKVFLDWNCIITYQDIQSFELEVNNNVFNKDKEMYYYLNKGEINQVKKIINEAFSKVNKGRASLSLLHYICSQLISILNRASMEFGHSLSANNESFNIKEVWDLESVEIIHNWMLEQFTLMGDIIVCKGFNCDNDIIRGSIKYICENYMKNLTLGDVAKHVNVSRTYFSQIFKQETNENYIDYLNKIRIEKAKELMKFNRYKSYEIAERVGFQDSSYFCKIFKKIENKTPSEYIRDIKM